MPEQSKLQDPSLPASTKEEQDRLQECKSKLVRIFGPTMFLTIISGGMLVTPRLSLGQKIMPDQVELTAFLARLASAGALFEFFANPIFGKLADRYGRRSVIAIPNFAVALCRALLFCFPDKKWPLIVEQSVCTPLVTSLFTVHRAALSDCLEGKDVAAATAKIGMFIGLSIVAGPLIAKAVMSRADPRYCYLISVGLASSSGLWLLTQFQETLPAEKRKPLVLNDMQPLSFFQLLRQGPLRKLLLIIGMQTVPEDRNMQNTVLSYLQHDLGWDWSRINNFIGLLGVSLILSGSAVGSLIARMGLRRFTTFSNACNIGTFAAFAHLPPLGLILSSDSAMYLGLALSSFGGRKRDAAETLIMHLGAKQNLGNGFIMGAMMNWRAVINVLAPILLARVYARRAGRGVFVAAACFVALAEVMLRALSDEELGLDAAGQLKEGGDASDAKKQ
mmetsp:Transcript_15593/g.49115  ORF Transcript_15593/g.49115 Transcript_15593/m.49115 type:complete len:448 (+) Transcript_15593:65-1408(+)|eukprot:CAMPEP_0204584262 /NCGR_PEP_ID=MMETSP0661-20131031/46239_1 /ASSEMBLY_ACC=CAM_ASM_000606 /TAXON_ID=109239 /ORGANISM="Alexandrium margalefi, Strain AMGDE01CS-322" /LENGTH=447 /DNA_ID=CAMNT_0051593695 /DNA_START=47 /DNA_END=1390 /DNA_ORIENTATION=-